MPACQSCNRDQYLYTGPICEDPRQAVPFSGQTWTSLAELGELSSDDEALGGEQKKRHNTLHEDEDDDRVVFLGTEPSFAIGQNRESIPQDMMLVFRRAPHAADVISGIGSSGMRGVQEVLYCQRLLQELATLMS